MSFVRILIADDFQDWRRQVVSLFQVRSEWQVIAEAADGPEAIQRVEELKPDLIVLDIGLPKLNGIEAARRIRQLSPNSKIVFLSQTNDFDVVQAALSTGALGYVHKTDAGSELLAAVEAALRGREYISTSLRDNECSDTAVEKAPHHHEVLFYSDDTVLLDNLTRFIAATLWAGNAAIVLATKSHRDSLLERLKVEGVDTDDALRQGTYISLDAADTLSTIMVNGLPDPFRFFGGIGGVIEAAAKAAKTAKTAKTEQPQVAVFGEAVALLQAEGKADAAIRFEQLGNDLTKTYKVDMLCAYPFSSFQGEEASVSSAASVRNTQPFILTEVVRIIPYYPAAALSLFASCRSSASGTSNSAVPQSKQTTISGNTHTTGLSISFSSGKWMAISAVNLLWLIDAHHLQGIIRLNWKMGY